MLPRKSHGRIKGGSMPGKSADIPATSTESAISRGPVCTIVKILQRRHERIASRHSIKGSFKSGCPLTLVFLELAALQAQLESHRQSLPIYPNLHLTRAGRRSRNYS